MQFSQYDSTSLLSILITYYISIGIAKQSRRKKSNHLCNCTIDPMVRVPISVHRGRLLAHETFNVAGSFDRSSGCSGLVGSTRSPGRTRVPWRHRRCSYLLVEFFLRPSYSSQLCKFHLSEVAR